MRGGHGVRRPPGDRPITPGETARLTCLLSAVYDEGDTLLLWEE